MRSSSRASTRLKPALFHVGVAIGFGLVGYAMRYFKVPFLPMVLGVVLGFMVESNYRRALVLASGDHMTFLHDSISAGSAWTGLRLRRGFDGAPGLSTRFAAAVSSGQLYDGGRVGGGVAGRPEG